MAEPLDFTQYTEADIQTPETVAHRSLNPLDVAIKTFGKAVKQNLWDAPIGVGQALGATIKDPFQGKIPGTTVVNAIGKEIEDKQARARLKGRTWYPGSETVEDIKQGWQESDPDKLSSGLGDILGIAGPEAMRFLPGSKLGRSLATGATESAAKNYEKIFNPLRTGEEGASLIPSVQRTARGLAETPEVIRGNAEKVGAQLRGLEQKYGPLTDTRSSTPTIDIAPLKKTITDAMDKHIYVQGAATKQVKNPTAKALHDELVQRIDNIATQTQQPGLAVYGSPRQAPGPSLVSEKALDDLKDMFNTRAKGKDIVMKTNPAVAIGDEAKWERVMANHLDDALNGINNVADAAEANYSLFTTAKRLYQSARNREFIDKAEGGIGLPISLGSGGRVKASLPPAVKEMIGGIKWNTVAASNKKAIARSLASGNWNKSITLLQLTKLGVPTPESYDAPTEP